MRRLPAWLLIAVLAGGPVCVDAAPPGEYQVKAAFLFNFSHFVSWPPSAFADAEAPLVIAVIGDDPFGASLDALVQGEHVGNRALVVRRYQDIAEVPDCHILFISRSASARLKDIVQAGHGHGVLTVSDIDDATSQGVMIGLVNQADHVRLKINIGAARDAGLKLSSQLLRPAQIVGPGSG